MAAIIIHMEIKQFCKRDFLQAINGELSNQLIYIYILVLALSFFEIMIVICTYIYKQVQVCQFI